MIAEGDQAPRFELPGFRDGAFEQVALDDYLGQEVIILAFYPGDFNPACSSETTGLDDLDLFTMQKDVSILGISGDSVYSHRAFAEEYNLHIPLLSDVDGEVAELYGVAVEDETAGHLMRRAIVVVDHTGTVEHTWISDDVEDLPDVDAVRAAVEGIGSDETAEARYGVGYAHYMEGRRAFTSAMKAYEEKDWLVARGDFERAKEEFDEARAEFNTSVRFGEDELSEGYFRQAERKSEALWRAAEWLAESAHAYASGEGATATSLREDAQTPLENAQALDEPPEPGDFPPDEPVAEVTEGPVTGVTDEPEPSSFLQDEPEEVDTSLGVDIDEVADQQATERDSSDASAHGDPARTEGETGDSSGWDDPPRKGHHPSPESGESPGRVADGYPGQATDGDTARSEADQQTDQQTDQRISQHDAASSDHTDPDREEQAGQDSIDDAELEEIAAELEEQTEAAQERRAAELEGKAGESDGDRGDVGEVDDEVDAEDIELDLVDPTEGRDEDDPDDDLGKSGGHGVPDSL